MSFKLFFNQSKKIIKNSSKKRLIGSISASGITSYLLVKATKRISFYNLNKFLNSGAITSSHFFKQCLPINIHERAKFFNYINKEDLKIFLSYLDSEYFIETLQSEYFSPNQAIEIIDFYNKKEEKEYENCFTLKGLQYLLSDQYPDQIALNLINKFYITSKEKNNELVNNICMIFSEM